MTKFPVGDSITLDELAHDPHPVLALLRAREPVSWLPALDGWLITSRALAIDVLRDPSTFTVDDPRFSTAQVVGPSMLSLDGSEHDRHRQPFGPPFRKRAVEGWQSVVEAEATNLVKGFAADGQAELRAQLAAPLAVAVITETLGLGETDSETILGWYRDIVAAVSSITSGADPPAGGRAAYRSLARAVERTIDGGGPSLVSTIATQGSLDREEISSNVAVVMFGAIETSEGMTSTALLHLLDHPDQLRQLTSDRTRLANAVEESLRLEPAAAVVDRYATADVTVDGVAIGQGDLVTVSLAAANRDPAVFDDPDRFDITRRNADDHLSFVQGPHTCLGMHLARLETMAAVEAVLDHLPGVSLDTERSQAPRGLIFRKAPAVVATW